MLNWPADHAAIAHDSSGRARNTEHAGLFAACMETGQRGKAAPTTAGVMTHGNDPHVGREEIRGQEGSRRQELDEEDRQQESRHQDTRPQDRRPSRRQESCRQGRSTQGGTEVRSGQECCKEGAGQEGRRKESRAEESNG
jgi:hypothetical protein